MTIGNLRSAFSLRKNTFVVPTLGVAHSDQRLVGTELGKGKRSRGAPRYPRAAEWPATATTAPTLRPAPRFRAIARQPSCDSKFARAKKSFRRPISVLSGIDRRRKKKRRRSGVG